MSRILCRCLLCFTLLVFARTSPAQTPLPQLATAQGSNAVITPAGNGINIHFLPAEWPSALWSAGENKAWDWQGHAILAFDAVNPGPEPIGFSVRVDDDPNADGVLHCYTAWTTLGPGASGAFYLSLTAVDPMQAEGMRGGPPPPGCEGMEAMTGTGAADPGHIVAFQIFLHQPAAPCSLNVSRLRLLPSPTTEALYSDICDPFGQFTRADWPGKVHTAADFSARRTSEESMVDQTPALPDRDAYGGWLNGPALTKTGYFYTTRRDGQWWLVTPSGHLFLSFGMNAVSFQEDTIVHPRESLFAWLPGPSAKTFDFYSANLERKYGPSYQNQWLLTAVARLKQWGFNTIGNWSNENLEALHQVPYTATLSVGGGHARISAASEGGVGMSDPFDIQFAVDCNASFRDKAMRVSKDHWCLGYFVDNELPWSGGTVEDGRYGLAYQTLAAPAEQPAKQAFLAQLQAKYITIEDFDAAWGLSLKGWGDLSAPFGASQTPNGVQKADMEDFVYRFARQYFTVVRDTLRKYDPNHLYLGCRFAGRNADVERAAAEACDVVSFSVYQTRLEPAAWAFTEDLNKPCLVDEFHFGALDRGMFSPGLVAAPNQAARAVMYRDYINTVIANPAFVGAHWYKYTDEPLTGRSLDGENYNIGFVSITDTPYPEIAAAARQVLTGAYARRAGPRYRP